MKTFSIIGSIVVLHALLFYSIGFYRLQRKRVINKRVLFAYSLGLVLDVAATVLMILGSTKGLFTLHGALGYSALLGMGVDIVLLWRHFKYNLLNEKVNLKINLYSKIAYSWWVVAFITGGLMVAFSHIK